MGYPVGFVIGRLPFHGLKKYGYEGQKARLLLGFDEKLEPPPARPLRSGTEEVAAAYRREQVLRQQRESKRTRYQHSVAAKKEQDEAPHHHRALMHNVH